MDISWKTILTDSYGILWKMIIRPPRSQYDVADLGPKRFRLREGDKAFERIDLQLVNDRNMRLECSHYVPFVPPGTRNELRPCVVCLHGNCSSRLEACDIWQVLLPRGITVFTVDLAGSGLSEGEYISLGHYEERDLKAVIEHLRNSGEVSAVGLWGRSMGAATSILRASEDWDIAGVVLDSPFSSLRVVAEELVHSNSGGAVPDFLLNAALQMVRGEIKTRAQFDIEELSPVRRAPQARAPALFATASDDDFVLPHHTRKLHEVWGEETVPAPTKKLVEFLGGHNGCRPQSFLDEAADFLQKHLRTAAELAAPRFYDAPPASQRTSRIWDDGAEDVVILPPPPPEPEPAFTSPPSSPSTSAHMHSSPSRSAPSRQVASREPLTRHNATPEAIRAQKLQNMGFSTEMAVEGARRFPTVEAGIEWILKQSVQILQESAQTLGRVELRAPTQRAPAAPVRRDEARSPPGGGYSAASAPRIAPAAAVAEVSARSVAVEDLVKQLRELGFSSSQATEAARRNSSVDGAVNWLLEDGRTDSV